MLGSVRRYISRCEAKMSTRNVARSLRTWLARGANTEVAAHRRRLPRTTRPCEPCHVHLTLDSNTERAIKALQGRCARRFVVGDAPRLDRLETPGTPTLAPHSIASPIGICDPIAKPGSAGAILHRNASPVLSCAHGGYRCLCMHTARYRVPRRLALTARPPER